MWNQKFAASTYENDPYEPLQRGVPPHSSADWGWVQHMLACLNDTGRMAVVLDTGAVSRGSGNQGRNKESDIRKAFVEDDLVEAVLLLPENLFYNTTAPGIILVLNRPSGTRAKSCSSTPRSCSPRAGPRTTSKTSTSSGSPTRTKWKADGRTVGRSSPRPRRPRTTTTSRPAGTCPTAQRGGPAAG